MKDLIETLNQDRVIASSVVCQCIIQGFESSVDRFNIRERMLIALVKALAEHNAELLQQTIKALQNQRVVYIQPDPHQPVKERIEPIPPSETTKDYARLVDMFRKIDPNDIRQRLGLEETKPRAVSQVQELMGKPTFTPSTHKISIEMVEPSKELAGKIGSVEELVFDGEKWIPTQQPPIDQPAIVEGKR